MKGSTIHKAGGILIKDKKLLVEKSIGKKYFIAPGGSIEEGETPKEALVRELLEEFRISVSISDLEEFGTFTADGPGKTVVMNTFLVKSWRGVPSPDHEVEQILWIDSNIPADIEVGSIIMHEIIPRLKAIALIS